jgi:dTDP-4-amino-4,6-dideoxygalactose transaminase
MATTLRTTESVPFVDMQSVNGPVMEELRAAFERVLASSQFVGGPEVERFEALLAERVGAKHAIGVSSGTSALQLALEAAGVGRGDEVVVPPNTFFATAEAVVSTGAEVVFADVDPETALIDPDAVRSALGPRTAAVIAVHLYGQPAEMHELGVLARGKGLLLLEDAAQAIGAAYRGRPAGSLADAAGFSFYPSKNLGALGDAGAVTTSDAGLADRIRLLRNHGQRRKYEHLLPAYNHRMDGLQGAFLAAKLPQLEEAQAERDLAAARYRSRLAEVPGVRLLRIAAGVKHVHHLLVVRVAYRDRILAALTRAGIEAGVHYPTPIHREPAWAGRPGAGASCPNAEALAASVLSLPIFPGITEAQIDRCAAALAEAVLEAA